MTNEELINGLKEILNHSCELDDADFGWYTCCNQRDYKGHGKNCNKEKIINEVIKKLEKISGMAACGMAVAIKWPLKEIKNIISSRYAITGGSYYSALERDLNEIIDACKEAVEKASVPQSLAKTRKQDEAQERKGKDADVA